MPSTRSTRYASPALSATPSRKRRVPTSTRASTTRTLVQERDLAILSSEQVDKFAKLADRAKILDPLDKEQGLVSLYAEICQDRLIQLRERSAAGAESTTFGEIEYNLFLLEKNTWDLCQRLYTLRNQIYQDDMDEDVIDHPYTPAKLHVDTIIQKDSALAEANIVKTWLQDINPPYDGIEIRRGGWFYTSRVIKNTKATGYNDQIKEAIVTELDPDAPSRQQRSLHQDDDAYEKTMIECLYNYTRNGKIDEAVDLCQQAEYFWRSATLRGSVLYNDPVFGKEQSSDVKVQIEGNKSRTLWKKMCRQMAADTALYSYERALYAALSGDVENVLQVCESWEDHAWAYYSAYLEERIERHLQSRGKAFGTDLPPSLASDLTPEKIFEQVSKVDKQQVKAASSDPFHLSQIRIILRQPKDLIIELNKRAEALSSAPSGSLNSLVYPNVLRFAVHFILFCRSLNIVLPDEDASSLIESYIVLLAESNKSNLIAQYTSYLPPRMQSLVYAKFLASVNEDKATRYAYLKQAQRYELDVESITRTTVDLILADAFQQEETNLDQKQVGFTGINERVLPEDELQIRALEWLCYRRDLYPFAVVQSNALVRRFLVAGKINAANQVHQRLPPDLVDRELVSQSYDVGRSDPMYTHYREIVHLKELLTNLALHAQWRAIFSKKPTSGSLNDWQGMIMATTTQLENNMMDQLTLDFLADCFSDDAPSLEEQRRQFQLRQIRRMYIPEIVFSLFTTLFETRDLMPSNLSKCMKVFVLVADSRNALFKEFMGKDNEKLKLLLSYIRSTSLVMLEHSPNPFSPL